MINFIQILGRHLAAKWQTEYISPGQQRRRYYGHSLTQLGTIEHFILLDLLGSPNPQIRNYYSDTAWLFDQLSSAETRLGEEGHFAWTDAKAEVKEMDKSKWKSWFKTRTGATQYSGGISDDHLPFLARGVSILHVIANPFPHVWHSMQVRTFL